MTPVEGDEAIALLGVKEPLSWSAQRFSARENGEDASDHEEVRLSEHLRRRRHDWPPRAYAADRGVALISGCHI